MALDHNIFIPTTVDKLYKPLALVVGIVVHHKPEIAVDSSHERLRILLTLALLQLGIVEVYTTERSSESAVAYVDAPRLNHGAHIQHTLLIRLYVYLLGMKRNV